MRNPFAAAVMAVVVFVGCGGDPNVGTRWAEAVDDERWDAACAVTVSRRDCESRLQRLYAGRDVRLLDAGEYQEGSNVTNNETRFAVEASRRGLRSTTYYEVGRQSGRDVVEIKIVIEGS